MNNCEGTFGNTCGTPRPEYQHNLRTTWQSGPATLSLLWRYLGESDDDRIENADVAANTLAVPNIDAINYFDLSGSWQFNEQFRLNAGIRNLLDKEPQAIGSVAQQSNTFPEMYDVFGRRYFVSASYKF